MAAVISYSAAYSLFPSVGMNSWLYGQIPAPRRTVAFFCLLASLEKNRTKFVREWPRGNKKHYIFLFTVPCVVLSEGTRHFFDPELLTAVLFPDILFLGSD